MNSKASPSKTLPIDLLLRGATARSQYSLVPKLNANCSHRKEYFLVANNPKKSQQVARPRKIRQKPKEGTQQDKTTEPAKQANHQSGQSTARFRTQNDKVPPRGKYYKSFFEEQQKQILSRHSSPINCIHIPIETRSITACIKRDSLQVGKVNKIPISKAPAKYQLHEGFKMAYFTQEAIDPFINHEEDITAYAGLIVANTANFKYITMSIQVGEDYTDVLKTLGPLLNCARDWSQQIFFCGLIGPESECFFWLGRPFLAQERMQADESIRQFVAQTNSTRKSLLEKLYIVDYQGRLSFVQMVQTVGSELVKKTEKEHLVGVRSLQKNSQSNFFARRMYTSKMLRDCNTVY